MNLIAVLGPTAAGKSTVAMALATERHAAILSVDSMQAYRGMDIGTAKPSSQDRTRVPHHLIDLAEPAEELTVATFQEIGRATLERLAAEHSAALVVGGSGLHFRALVDPMTFAARDPVVRAELEAQDTAGLVVELLQADPAAGALIDLANPRRVVRAVEIYRLSGETPSGRAATAEYAALRAYRSVVPFVAVGLDPGANLEGRVEARFDAMLEAGLLEEVVELAPHLGRTARQAVGYKQLLPVVSGEQTLAEGRTAAIRATLALAKRQRTFFRRDPRITWVPWHDDLQERLVRVRSILEEVHAWTS